MAIDEEVGGGAVDQLEALLGDRPEMDGRYAFAHHPTGQRDELEVDVRDALVFDAPHDPVDLVGPARRADEAFEVCRHGKHLSERKKVFTYGEQSFLSVASPAACRLC